MTIPAVEAPIEPESSPLRPGSLLELFLQPTRFFSGHISRGATPYVVFVTAVCGVAYAMGRVDKQVMKADLGARANALGQVNALDQMGILESWLLFWGFVLLVGLVAAAFLWAVGGWWYRVRIKWSGAPDPDPRTARVVYIYATFVHALPALLVVAVATILYADYRVYWQADEMWPSIGILFPFWSCVTSYKGVRATFDVSSWKARIWFLILPIIVYTLGFGLLAVLYALSGGA